MENKTSLLGMTTDEIARITHELGMPRFAAKQISEWIYRHHVVTIHDMTNISKRNRELLAGCCDVGCRQPVETHRSADGTVKYLFPTEAGAFVETVYIPDGDRATLCVSCQVGCKMNCLFCQTGKQGFGGNLTVNDIINQVYSVEEADKLTNIVFMGQGEPFDNLDAVMKALRVLTSPDAYAWSPHRITVSTVGLKKNLRRFVEESECHLAVSLHSPVHEQRLELMPAERQFAIADIVKTLAPYDFSHQRRLSFEYILFKGVNDTMEHAARLVQLLSPLTCRVNLIRFHQIPDVPLQGTTDEQVMAFRDYLTRHGLFATVRASRGQDILAACGMLNTERMNRLADHPNDNA